MSTEKFEHDSKRVKWMHDAYTRKVRENKQIFLENVNTYLKGLAAARTCVWPFEWFDYSFQKIPSVGDPLESAKWLFQDHPTYILSLTPLEEWQHCLEKECSQAAIRLSDEECKTVLTLLTMLFDPEKVRVWRLNLQPQEGDWLNPHYAVWWLELLFQDEQHLYWLHFAVSD